MPSSYPHTILPILQTIENLKPKSILDIGFGRGKYGFLIKEYFPSIKCDGLEVFENYITELQKQIYGKIFIRNALNTEIRPYDLYLLIDIIEHWERPEVYKLLDKLLENGNVIIATPNKFIEQGEVNGNKWETHKSFWVDMDFRKYSRFIIQNDLSLIMVLYGRLVQTK